MSHMFYYATNFNKDLFSWNVSNVTNMSKMFYYASNFNQDLSDWDVLIVTKYNNMFDSTNFDSKNNVPKF